MIYKGFASVYDYLMSDTPYDQWYVNLKEILQSYGHTGKDVLDLACGTGEMSNRLAKDGYKVLGVDLSPEMLETAQQKAYENNLKVHYIHQDMTCLELFHTYDLIVSYCDGFNYIRTEDALEQVFQRVHQYLKPGGLFVFDMSSYYKLSQVLGENVIAETSEDVAFIWENYFDEQTHLLEFDLTIFEREDNHYKRTEEVHVQKAYTQDQIMKLLHQTGFELLEMRDTDMNKDIEAESQRWLFVGRRKYE